MTVGELKKLLKYADDEMEVVMADYAEVVDVVVSKDREGYIVVTDIKDEEEGEN